MNRLNTDMVYSSERQIFDIQTREIMYNPPPNKEGLYSRCMPQELCQLVSLVLLEGPPFNETVEEYSKARQNVILWSYRCDTVKNHD